MNGITMKRAFWTTIFLFAAAVIVLWAVAAFRGNSAVQDNAEPALLQEPPGHEIPRTRIGTMLVEAAQFAEGETRPLIGNLVEKAYAPVYDAIPAYADFHYSILGEYTELGQAAFGKMNEQMSRQLFHRLPDDLEKAGLALDTSFGQSFQEHLRSSVDEELDQAEQPTLARASQFAIDDSLRRMKVTAPIALTTFSGATAATVLATTLMKKAAAKGAGKAAAKTAAKAGGMTTAALTSVAICAPTGPIAIVCGLGAATAVWFATDAVVVNVDEFFTRDQFEADLTAMIDEHKATTSADFEIALKRKATAVADFTFSEKNAAPAAP